MSRTTLRSTSSSTSVAAVGAEEVVLKLGHRAAPFRSASGRKGGKEKNCVCSTCSMQIDGAAEEEEGRRGFRGMTTFKAGKRTTRDSPP